MGPAKPEPDETGPDDSSAVRPDETRPYGDDQLVGELVPPAQLVAMQDQARAWASEPDGGVASILDWATQRSYVHLQLQDHIASGAVGQAKITNALRAGRAFTEAAVKILRAARPREEPDSKPSKASKSSKPPTPRRSVMPADLSYRARFKVVKRRVRSSPTRR